jgi:type I protein arginine methyltransferase
MEFAATRVASSERLMSIAYDISNQSNFGGLGAHEEMLSDSVRVNAYHRAIHRNVQPGDVVLDLGTGTGLLAFMASRAGAKKVYALEHSDVIDLAREVAARNGFTNIEFVRSNSREFMSPEPIDVVLHEQMGDELFNENMLDNVLDIRNRVLRPGGRILPAHFKLFVEPVSLNPLMRVRRLWNVDLPDEIDFSSLEGTAIAERLSSSADDTYWVRPGSVSTTLGQAQPIVEFDLHTLASPSAIATSHVVERIAPADMVVDGVCVWFEAWFDDETVLSTSPLQPITSWGNRVFRLDTNVAAGEQVRLRVDLGTIHEPTTWAVRRI